MAKTISAHEQPVSKIFSDDYVFYIPGYQRPYAWTTEQARELFDDINQFRIDIGGAIEEMPPYFLGSVVLIKEESSPESDIVDGQQRLTTLTILLSAIRASVVKKTADEITPLIYEKGSTIRGAKDRFRLTLRERDQDFFQNYIQREEGISELVALNEPLTDSRNNIKENARLFLNLLSSLTENERVNLAQFIVTRCFLVIVSTPDLDSAYRIFSVLNSRGLDLSATDILKASITGGITETLRDAYTEKWEDTEETLGRDRFGDLFSHVRMIYRKAKPQGTLIKEFKDHVQGKVSEPTRLIDEVILPMARAYEEILNSSYESTSHADAVNEHIQWLNRLAFSDWVPPALAYLTRHRQSPELVATFFQHLERLGFGLLILKSGINDRIERFSRLTREIEKGTNLMEPSSALQPTSQEQEKIYEHLNGSFYEELSAPARTAVLLRLDSLLSAGGATYNYEIVTVEHVLPQTPKTGSVWLTWFPKADERALWTHRIGNLALLTRRKNSAASNYDFQKKKDAYFTQHGISPFVLTTQVLGDSEWTPKIVEQRQQKLMDTLTQHWNIVSSKP
jgi:hypothetical protein